MIDLAIVGGITGSLGMVTGAAGAIVSIVCLHRMDRIKSSDLRLVRINGENRVTVALAEISELCDKAYQSRLQRLSLEGGVGRSLEQQKWKEQIERYKLQIQELSRGFERFKRDVAQDSVERLERDIAKLQLIEMQIQSFADKFKNLIAEDNVVRVKMMRAGYAI